MQFEEYRKYDAVGLAELIRKGEVSADEVLQTALNRLDAVNPKLNLLAHDLRERAFSWQRPSENPHAPLVGVPFLLKDLIADWEGTPTWSGSRMMKNYVAKQNSALTQAYLNAGLRIFGKTTTPEWGAYPVTETEIYGITRNPWNLSYTPGGSSGGSAAAVAAGVVPAAHGGDGGGSIRVPAHNCGIFGLKPSRGRSSFEPLQSEAWQGLVNEHVLTRSVRDSALFLDIAAQTQTHALYACPRPAESFSDGLKHDTGRLKIAFWRKPWFGGENDADTQAAFGHSLKLLSDAGHDLEEASPDFSSPKILNRAARVLVMGETAKLLYLHQQATGQKLHHSQLEPTTWALISQGQQISAGEMAWARDVMLTQGRAAEAFFTRYDVLMTPICPRTTPKIGELMPSETEQKIIRLLFGTLKLGWLMKQNPLIEKEAERTLQYIGYAAPFNMSGNPAMSVPLFWHNGLPIGTQFAAAHGREDLLLRLAAQLEQIQPWAEKQPPIDIR
ncbi:6-aminohexanoate hydrolase [Neisseria sp. 74A18]|nr:amidase [Neisseria sp. 74A18]KPN74246.1 6-aminohexanoate hydrolase [Neisseria sp. 74A18]